MADETQSTALKGARVRELRKKLGLKQRQIADRLGVSNAAVSQWENGGGIDYKKLTALARILKTTSDDLMAEQNVSRTKIDDTITIIDKTVSNLVPLISLRGLTVDNVVSRKRSAADGDEFRISSSPASDNAFAAEIADHSMEPDYRPGEYIVVDTLEPEPGDHIVAHIKPQNSTVFRVFEFDGADHMKLSPLNPQHRVLRFSNEEWQRDVDVLGVMVFHGRMRRVRHTS